MAGRIEISVGDVNDVEARVVARFVPDSDGKLGDAELVEIRGTLRGPFCEGTRTLPAEIRFRQKAKAGERLAEAVVPDPCTWTPELPHLYQADLEARHGDALVAEFHAPIGLRRSAP